MFYEYFADSYDEMIDWPSRLEREQTSLNKLLSDNDVKTVMDAGCGTGIHSIILSKLGYEVTAVDSCLDMLEISMKNATNFKVDNIKFLEGDFITISKLAKKPFDALLCLGNSLPHILDDDDVVVALKEFKKSVKPGGLIVLQTVHFDHYLDTADSAVAVGDGMHRGRPVTFRRHYEFKGTKVVFHVSIYDRNSRELLETFSSPLNAIRREVLEAFMTRAGYKDVKFYADFDLSPIGDNDRSIVIVTHNPEIA